jgi:quinol monooxygenase YgiN
MSHQFTSPRLGQSQRQLASPLLDSKVGLAGCNSRPGRPQRLHICAAIKKDTAKHVVCSKTLVGKPDQVKRLQRKCQDILDFSLGRAANKQNGILEFTCSQDSYATNVFHFWERYDGNTSMGRHNTTPEFMKFMEGVSYSHTAVVSRTYNCCRVLS